MVDAVTTKVVRDDDYIHEVHLTGISDGTGEVTVIKVDKSAIGVASDGAEPASLDIVGARWSIQGYASIRLRWNHTTPETALVLAGNGAFEVSDPRMGIPDGRGAGGTGDIELSSGGAAANATYDITLRLRKRPS